MSAVLKGQFQHDNRAEDDNSLSAAEIELCDQRGLESVMCKPDNFADWQGLDPLAEGIVTRFLQAMARGEDTSAEVGEISVAMQAFYTKRGDIPQAQQMAAQNELNKQNARAFR